VEAGALLSTTGQQATSFLGLPASFEPQRAGPILVCVTCSPLPIHPRCKLHVRSWLYTNTLLGAAMDWSNPADEDDCSVCGDWPKADLTAMRGLIRSIPLQEEICDQCLMAFVANFVGELQPARVRRTRH
jgi:hypothetical protein